VIDDVLIAMCVGAALSVAAAAAIIVVAFIKHRRDKQSSLKK
jgi:hypothetical protein